MIRRLSSSTPIQRCRRHAWQDLGGECVILDLDAGIYYGLDDVGSRVWNLIHAPITVAAVRDTLVAEYDVDPARCGQDLLRLLRQMAAAGLIETAESGPGRIGDQQDEGHRHH